MSIAAALMSAALLGAASPNPPLALDIFMRICASAPTMQAMESAAKSQGALATTYPEDIRAGFLAELIRSANDVKSTSYAEIYTLLVAEGSAYFIFGRTEPIFGSTLPPSYLCQLHVFDFRGPAPEPAMSKALKNSSIEPWRDEWGNEVFNWYAVKDFPGRKFQLSRTVSKTSLAGPAGITGLAFSVDVSGDRN